MYLSIVLETRPCISVLFASHAHINGDLSVLSLVVVSNSKDLDLYYLSNLKTFEIFGASGTNI